MAFSALNPSVGRARTWAACIVVAVIAIGTTTTLLAGPDSIWRELGLALVSGGVVGGALVAVESVLTSAADRRSSSEALLRQLSTTIELSGIDLSGADLPGIYLPGRALVAANLEFANLVGARLQFCDFRSARLEGSDLRRCDLSGSNLQNADLRDCDLTGADLSDANLEGADLRGAILSEANLDGVRLHSTRLGGCELAGAQVRNCILDGADLRARDLRRAVLEGNQHDDSTRWPEGYEADASVAVSHDVNPQLSLADYLALRVRKSADGTIDPNVPARGTT